MSVTEKCSSENYENVSLFIDNEVCKSVYLKCIIILIDFFILFFFSISFYSDVYFFFCGIIFVYELWCLYVCNLHSNNKKRNYLRFSVDS